MSQSPIIRVVLADDHPVVRAGIRDALEKDAGIRIVGEASSGDEAVAVVQHEDPEVALFDIQMPPTSGIEAMRRILRDCPGTRVIILTVHNSDPYWEAALHAGASGFISKHASMEQLHIAVRTVAAGGTFFSPEITRRLAEREAGRYTVDGRVVNALSTLELDTLRVAAKGNKNAETAAELGITEQALKSRLRSILRKLGVDTRLAAVNVALREGWIDLAADEVLLAGKPTRGA